MRIWIARGHWKVDDVGGVKFIWVVVDKAPLENVKVNLDDNSQLTGKIIQMFQTTNQDCCQS